MLLVPQYNLFCAALLVRYWDPCFLSTEPLFPWTPLPVPTQPSGKRCSTCLRSWGAAVSTALRSTVCPVWRVFVLFRKQGTLHEFLCWNHNWSVVCQGLVPHWTQSWVDQAGINSARCRGLHLRLCLCSEPERTESIPLAFYEAEKVKSCVLLKRVHILDVILGPVRIHTLLDIYNKSKDLCVSISGRSCSCFVAADAWAFPILPALSHPRLWEEVDTSATSHRVVRQRQGPSQPSSFSTVEIAGLPRRKSEDLSNTPSLPSPCGKLIEQRKYTHTKDASWPFVLFK